MADIVDSKAEKGRGIKGKFEHASDSDQTEYFLIYEDLLKDCSSADAESGLSESVQIRLEKCKPDLRKEIVDHEGLPLVVACLHEKMEIVEYLITHCKANVNKRGQVDLKFLPSRRQSDMYSSHLHGGLVNDRTVSPLWIAAIITKNLPMVKFLITHGANVNGIMCTENTVLQDLCFRNDGDIEIMRYLLQNGADLHKRYLFGETCLLKCQDKTDKFLLLLEYGADIEARDTLCATLLHRAVITDNVGRIKFLLLQNANPYAKYQNNNDALESACLHFSMQAFDYLIKNVHYFPEKLADIYELRGSVFARREDYDSAFKFWEESLDIRRKTGVHGRLLPKNFGIVTKMIFPNAKEFTTSEELNTIITDSNSVKMQTLISFERILGLTHEKTLQMLMEETISYDLPRRMTLLRRILEIAVEQDRTVLHESIGLLETLMPIFNDENFRQCKTLKFCDVSAIFEALFVLFSKSKLVLELDSRRDIPREYGEDCLQLILFPMFELLMLLLKMAQTDEENTEIQILVCKLMPRTNTDQEYLKINKLILQTCIRFMKTLKQPKPKASSFLKMIKLFLVCGADLNARDNCNRTPLHLAAFQAANKMTQHLSVKLVKLFLKFGAHIDCPDIFNRTSANYLLKISWSDFNLMSHMSLKCFAAQAICKYGIQSTELPEHLYHFIDCHR